MSAFCSGTDGKGWIFIFPRYCTEYPYNVRLSISLPNMILK